MELEAFRELFKMKTSTGVDFSVPGHGLILQEVQYPEGFFDEVDNN
jgi:hypothetical protein